MYHVKKRPRTSSQLLREKNWLGALLGAASASPSAESSAFGVGARRVWILRLGSRFIRVPIRVP